MYSLPSGVIAQVDQTKSPGQSSGQRPEPLAGPHQQQPPAGLSGRVKRFFLGDKMDAERLKGLGIVPYVAQVLPLSMLSCNSLWLEHKCSSRGQNKQEVALYLKGLYMVTVHTRSYIAHGCQCENVVRSLMPFNSACLGCPDRSGGCCILWSHQQRHIRRWLSCCLDRIFSVNLPPIVHSKSKAAFASILLGL